MKKEISFKLDEEVTNAVIKNEVDKEQAKKDLAFIERKNQILEQIKDNRKEEPRGTIFYTSVKQMQGRALIKTENEEEFLTQYTENKVNLKFLNLSDEEKKVFKNYYFESFSNSIDKESNKKEFYKDLEELLLLHGTHSHSVFGRMSILRKLYKKGLRKSTFSELLMDKIEFWKDFYVKENSFFRITALTSFIASIFCFMLISEYSKAINYLFSSVIGTYLILPVVILVPLVFMNLFWQIEHYSFYEKKIHQYFEYLKDKHGLKDIKNINTIEFLYNSNKCNDSIKNDQIFKVIYDEYVFDDFANNNHSLELIKQVNKSFKDLLSFDIISIKNKIKNI